MEKTNEMIDDITKVLIFWMKSSYNTGAEYLFEALAPECPHCKEIISKVKDLCILGCDHYCHVNCCKISMDKETGNLLFQCPLCIKYSIKN